MSILPEKLERYRKFFLFLIKYWNSDVVNHTEQSINNDSNEETTEEFDQSPEEFANDLKDMGPTYVKLGQLLSTRPDLLPNAYLEALSELQDNVESIPFEDIEAVFEQEIGVRISKAFDLFDPKPMACASIGQVHKARLHSGVEVAVKIQKPGIKDKFLADLETLTEMANWAAEHSDEARKYNVAEVIDELKYILIQELNYTSEAHNLSTLRNNLKGFEHLYVPAPIPDYCSSQVLTMEFIEGRKITKTSPLKLLEEDMTPLVDDLVEGYVKQIIIDGFVHADPHPGNVYMLPDNKIALIDLGMVARFTKEMQEQVMQLMIALSKYDSDRIVDILLEISKYDETEADLHAFKKEVVRVILASQNATAKDMKTGRLVIHMNRIAAQNRIHIPVGLNILGKILLNLDQIVMILAPHYDINAAIKKSVNKLMRAKAIKELKSENFLDVLLEVKKLAESLPERFNKILKHLAENEFKLKIDAIDEVRLTDTLHKVANRITVGIIIAAMIIGAALLIQIPTSWTIFGYPGLAIILFLIAALLGFYLIYSILFKDDDMKR
ncbi:AarF/ABC1/UbiB kinase family protein [Fulvivirga sp. RKSG066]|uniref:ABC1 kinase family protein n=1 Tax=Fulvivirga aurantia TaxID=2529383 RepID=UPI0012BD48A8|nr:AarF/UbiB family protein [Fulvivirga aurantia]MTI21763.1 AarF/ABC1/UbiB kinase family protein [Fulvivirga aurantia]